MLRGAVYRVVEGARRDRRVVSALDAAVTIHAPPHVIALLTTPLLPGPDPRDQLAELLVASSVCGAAWGVGCDVLQVTLVALEPDAAGTEALLPVGGQDERVLIEVR